jgi:hypothetical protein
MKTFVLKHLSLYEILSHDIFWRPCIIHSFHPINCECVEVLIMLQSWDFCWREAYVPHISLGFVVSLYEGSIHFLFEKFSLSVFFIFCYPVPSYISPITTWGWPMAGLNWCKSDTKWTQKTMLQMEVRFSQICFKYFAYRYGCIAFLCFEWNGKQLWSSYLSNVTLQ